AQRDGVAEAALDHPVQQLDRRIQALRVPGVGRLRQLWPLLQRREVVAREGVDVCGSVHAISFVGGACGGASGSGRVQRPACLALPARCKPATSPGFSLPSSACSCSCSLRDSASNSETTQRSWPVAISAKRRRPFGDSLSRIARRSSATGSRVIHPSASSWSARPVTLPPVTIRRCDSSLILSPRG